MLPGQQLNPMDQIQYLKLKEWSASLDATSMQD